RVSNAVSVYDIGREQWLDEAGVREKFGVAPSQIPDLLALHGDHVDNIPGVMGVGEKTARQILSVYSSIESLDDENPGATLKFRGRNEILRRIRNNMETVRISRKLATICCDAPIEVSPHVLRYRRAEPRILQPLRGAVGVRGLL